ncbi:Xaa-Pro peptidase family protein [Clostridium sp. BJN0001]|uniref:M24 family metallopeptidase n=1 Tax=Clostridium sp. BJN0001 TaxID=2930219 RepID=UPI001FD2CCC5|nr:Xaa-Pro peptidase family protein [Clostridium sp. BJN0001]
MKNRIDKVIEKMKEKNVYQIIVTSKASLYYLTGILIESGERMIAFYINTDGEKKLIINKLFSLPKHMDIETIWYTDSDDPVSYLNDIVKENEVLGIDKFWPSCFLLHLMEFNKVKKFINSSDIIDEMRMVKDEKERELMRKSSKINDTVMEKFFNELKEGISEKACAKILQDLYETEGASGESFSSIVAFGVNAADPHHMCDDTKLEYGDNIIIDIGGIYNNYCSDMTRTVFYKKEPDFEKKKIYEIVKEANLKAISKVKEGVTFSDIDKEARSYIEQKGYGKFFTHRTGHSVGIEIHDKGDVSSSNNDTVKEGMIFSIEPGIYIPNEYGVRIEDLVMVKKDGVEVLNGVSKELKVIE